jgi:hypothetical protein
LQLCASVNDRALPSNKQACSRGERVGPLYRTAHSLNDDTNITSNSAQRERELWRNQSRLSHATSGQSRKRHVALHQSANEKTQYSRHQLHMTLRELSCLMPSGDACSKYATVKTFTQTLHVYRHFVAVAALPQSEIQALYPLLQIPFLTTGYHPTTQNGLRQYVEAATDGQMSQ